MQRIVIALAAALVIVVGGYFLFVPYSPPPAPQAAAPTAGPAPVAPSKATPVAGVEKGSAVNFAAAQADFAGKLWSAQGVTVAANAAPGPDGNPGAYRMTESAANSLHRILTDLSGVKPDTYTLSVYVKPGERSGFGMEMSDAKSGKYGKVMFDLAQKQVRSSAGDVVADGLQELPNGWFRVWAAMPYSTENVALDLALASLDFAGFGYIGNGSAGLFLWGPQFETGRQPTGYDAAAASAN